MVEVFVVIELPPKVEVLVAAEVSAGRGQANTASLDNGSK